MCNGMNENEILDICRKWCGKKTTIEHILNDTEKCNFCDVAYMAGEMMEEKIEVE